jgi:hypothetical protein
MLKALAKQDASAQAAWAGSATQVHKYMLSEQTAVK